MVPRAELHDQRRLAHGRPVRHRLQRHRGRGRLRARTRSRCRWATPAAASARARSRTPPTSTSCPSTRSSPAPSPRRSSAWRPGAYAEHVDMQQKRVRAAYLGEKASLDPFAAVRIAKASSEIDAAWALLVANIREEQAHVAKGEKIPLGLRLRVRRDQVLGTQRAIDADRLALRGLRRPGARPAAPTSSAPGATPTPAGCTPPTTPSGRCRCTARTSSGTRSTRGCTDRWHFTKESVQHSASKAGRRDHPQLLRGRERSRRRRRPAAGDAARRRTRRLGVVQLRPRAAALRGVVPHPARRPARLRRLRQAAGGGQLLPALGRLRRQSSSTSSASTGSTCSATAWAAVRRCASRSATPTGSAG